MRRDVIAPHVDDQPERDFRRSSTAVLRRRPPRRPSTNQRGRVSCGGLDFVAIVGPWAWHMFYWMARTARWRVESGTQRLELVRTPLVCNVYDTPDGPQCSADIRRHRPVEAHTRGSSSLKCRSRDIMHDVPPALPTHTVTYAPELPTYQDLHLAAEHYSTRARFMECRGSRPPQLTHLRPSPSRSAMELAEEPPTGAGPWGAADVSVAGAD
ncbi:hypothetical protein OH77DRAFT_1420392 [Trametes cingulata]|nr:hypothetical protein OH77DRAFT_1420392 [Trametes cingulata]